MIDLSTSEGIATFTSLYSTRRGRWLANRLALSGKGSEALANNVSALAWNARALEFCETDSARRIYSHKCFIALKAILASPLFYLLRGSFRFPPIAHYSSLASH